MFFTSSLLPTGSASQCDTDCTGGYFGFTDPSVALSGGRLNISNLWLSPNIWVGQNGIGDFGDQYSFAGGRYTNGYTSPQLVPGKWRIFAFWWAMVGGEAGGLFFDNQITTAQIDNITTTLLIDTLSLARKDASVISKINLAQWPSSTDAAGNIHVGGIDGCQQIYDNTFPAKKLPAFRFADVTVPQRTVAYLQASVSPNFAAAKALIDPIPADTFGGDNFRYHYQIAGFYMDGCRCGGFLESSYSMGY